MHAIRPSSFCEFCFWLSVEVSWFHFSRFWKGLSEVFVLQAVTGLLGFEGEQR